MNAKTGVVVTNRHKGGTPILKVWFCDEYEADVVFEFSTGVFTFKPRENKVVCTFGGKDYSVDQMTKRSAKKFGADYGIWFSS